MTTNTTRLLSPTNYSSQYVGNGVDEKSASSSSSYVPPRTQIEHLRVRSSREYGENSVLDEEITIDGRLPASEDDDDGFKTFPGIIVMPRWWQWLGFFLLAIFAVLAFTVLKEPLEKIGLTSEHLLKFGSIPLISIVFTYIHIWLALWMTFFPIEYFGVCQIPGTNTGLGWQGIVPFKSEKMARMAVKLMTQRLFDVREIFSRLEPSQVAAEMGPVLHQTLDAVISGVAKIHSPDLWNLLPLKVRSEIVAKAHEDAPPLIAGMMRQMQENITEIFNIEEHVVGVLMKDKALLCNIFISCGHKELSFIRNSGAYMGGIFGIIQMIIWIVYSNKWLLPGFGFVVGTITNWLALKMIFSPIEPHYPCGKKGVKIQGLFLQRQKEVAVVYAKTIARKVLNSKSILRSLIAGPATEKLFTLVHNHVRQACDDFTGAYAKPILTITVGSETYESIKEDISTRIVDALPPLLISLEEYTDRALDMETTLRTKMSELPSAEFESLLHPVFEEDEWKLVLMGGVLGVIIGMAQIEMLGA